MGQFSSHKNPPTFCWAWQKSVHPCQPSPLTTGLTHRVAKRRWILESSRRCSIQFSCPTISCSGLKPFLRSLVVVVVVVVVVVGRGSYGGLGVSDPGCCLKCCLFDEVHMVGWVLKYRICKQILVSLHLIHLWGKNSSKSAGQITFKKKLPPKNNRPPLYTFPPSALGGNQRFVFLLFGRCGRSSSVFFFQTHISFLIA